MLRISNLVSILNRGSQGFSVTGMEKSKEICMCVYIYKWSVFQDYIMPSIEVEDSSYLFSQVKPPVSGKG